VLNLTGPETVAVRRLALAIGRRLGREPVFAGTESATALLSNAARCLDLFGAPATPLDQMIDLVADWVAAGGSSLGRPTHFEEREGAF
jgi:nucleoside-diphosphate-sugar epimerase